MECSFCKKPPRGGLFFIMEEVVPGGDAQKKKACFPCIMALGEKIMRPPEPVWRVEVHGVCAGCKQAVPAGFYTCDGTGAHEQIT